MFTIVDDEESPIDSIIKSNGIHFENNRKANGDVGADICKQIQELNKPKCNELLYLDQDPCLYVSCTITKECFSKLLSFYRNNHRYHIQTNDKESIVNLESWFIQVIEPPPSSGNINDIEEWNNREAWKLKGYTYYCEYKDKNKLRISGKVMNQVRTNYGNLKPWRVR